MDLVELREKIDEIDEQIVELYEQRMDIASQVADYKMETGKKVFDKERENEKLSKVRELAHNDFNKYGIQELFEQIMSMSRKLQYQKLTEQGNAERLPFIGVDELKIKKAKVVFQGEQGAYSEMAMWTFFGENVDCFHVDTFRDAMCALEEGSADYA
nr:chorismate mutase [Lachnospiraceae bacterium]